MVAIDERKKGGIVSYFSVALAASTCSRFVCLMITSQSWRKREGGSVYRGGNKSGLTTPSFRFRPLLMLSQLVSDGLRFLAL